ncbi:hypothetical protein UT300012_22730 [Paraclostridium bifermentans]
MSRVRNKKSQKRYKKSRRFKIALGMLTAIVNSVVLLCGFWLTLVFVVITTAFNWKKVDKIKLTIFGVINLLGYFVIKDSIMLFILVIVASSEILYLENNRPKETDDLEVDVVSNIIELMNLNYDVMSTVWLDDNRYDYNNHNGTYETRNIVRVTMNERFLSDYINESVVTAKDMLGVQELNGKSVLNAVGKLDLSGLLKAKDNAKIVRVYETLEQEQYVYQDYIDNRVDLIKSQLNRSYNIDGVGDNEVTICDYTQELMSNQVKVKQRLTNLQTLVNQIVERL